MHGTATHQRTAAPPPGRFDPFAGLSRMATQKDFIETTLSAEKHKPRPNEAVVSACEAWLRVYEHERARLITATAGHLRRIAETP